MKIYINATSISDLQPSRFSASASAARAAGSAAADLSECERARAEHCDGGLSGAAGVGGQLRRQGHVADQPGEQRVVVEHHPRARVKCGFCGIGSRYIWVCMH